MPRRAVTAPAIDLDDLPDCEQDEERLVVALPMPVARARDADRDRLLSLLKERVPDPSVFDEREPFLWQMIASNTNLDSYYTSMHKSTLANFAEDANVGVAFQNSHRWMELPFGRTLRGQFREKRAENPTRAILDGYTMPGLNLNGINTDELIAGMRAGIVSDVSVGFYGGKTVCDLCGGNYESFRECQHWLGFDYEDEQGNRQVATATIHDAHLAEVSAVYDGACPGAGVVKVYRSIETGEIPDELVRRFGSAGRLLDAASERYRVNVRGRRHYPAFTARDTEATMPEKQQPSEDGISPEWRVALKEAGLDQATAPLTAFRTLWGELVERRSEAAEVETLRKKNAELAPLADDGKAYRADLIEETVSEGKRAFGNAFREETQRAILADQPLVAIKETRDMWRVTGDAKFTQGRQTTDGERPPDEYTTQFRTPARAHRV